MKRPEDNKTVIFKLKKEKNEKLNID